MPSHPSSPGKRDAPAQSKDLEDAAVEQTGNEDPGSELTELPPGTTPDEDAPRKRTLDNHPVDPNSIPARVGLPIGVDKETAADPGRQTPDAPETDNRS
ncbi:hypothetical protein [uncultured Pigmentiphaga sp.]|uniref:hypothetical protein n=1 Tax=uncultured Pigmentiphaga sp. TaxID=340361 RepID=UPI00262655AA|nr:hypothetical protein [uncultured Pigmentiphaga sp.]